MARVALGVAGGHLLGEPHGDLACIDLVAGRDRVLSKREGRRRGMARLDLGVAGGHLLGKPRDDLACLLLVAGRDRVLSRRGGRRCDMARLDLRAAGGHLLGKPRSHLACVALVARRDRVLPKRGGHFRGMARLDLGAAGGHLLRQCRKAGRGVARIGLDAGGGDLLRGRRLGGAASVLASTAAGMSAAFLVRLLLFAAAVDPRSWPAPVSRMAFTSLAIACSGAPARSRTGSAFTSTAGEGASFAFDGPEVSAVLRPPSASLAPTTSTVSPSPVQPPWPASALPRARTRRPKRSPSPSRGPASPPLPPRLGRAWRLGYRRPPARPSSGLPGRRLPPRPPRPWSAAVLPWTPCCGASDRSRANPSTGPWRSTSARASAGDDGASFALGLSGGVGLDLGHLGPGGERGLHRRSVALVAHRRDVENHGGGHADGAKIGIRGAAKGGRSPVIGKRRPDVARGQLGLAEHCNAAAVARARRRRTPALQR